MYFGAWRVNGSLSVSRAIGDAEHKPYISGEPEVEEFILEGTVKLITLTCLQGMLRQHQIFVELFCWYMEVLVTGWKEVKSSNNRPISIY